MQIYGGRCRDFNTREQERAEKQRQKQGQLWENAKGREGADERGIGRAGFWKERERRSRHEIRWAKRRARNRQGCLDAWIWVEGRGRMPEGRKGYTDRGQTHLDWDWNRWEKLQIDKDVRCKMQRRRQNSSSGIAPCMWPNLLSWSWSADRIL